MPHLEALSADFDSANSIFFDITSIFHKKNFSNPQVLRFIIGDCLSENRISKLVGESRKEAALPDGLNEIIVQSVIKISDFALKYPIFLI